MDKKLTNLEKSSKILSDVKATQWCYVNTDNEFSFMDKTFIIDEKVKEYRVNNKAGTILEYTNEAYMDSILVVLNLQNKLSFYNQNYDEVEKPYVVVKG